MHPKPFIRLNDGERVLQKDFVKGSQQKDVREMLTVTNRELLFKTEDNYREINQENIPTSFILEPFGRNTAAAIAAATLNIRKHDDALSLLLAVDHLINDTDAFTAAVDKAVQLAETDKLVTFGIQPTAPETGYGYIETDEYDVKCLVEKPDLPTPKDYVASGRYFWNSGMFCFKSGVMLEQMQQHCPDILSAVEMCMEKSRTAHSESFEEVELDADSFKAVREDSIDFAVFEKSSAIAVVPCDLGWSDIGSWAAAMGELAPADENDNRAKDVKQVYADLKQLDHDSHNLHRTVYRPWGSDTVLEERPHFKIKHIEVKPHSS
uniref:Mannose-1-phosphate guanylyltransferase (GDP) n=2 Tax=Methylophaga nitratireducenticrescens TaxID=754476 RepID=I1XHS0_METNJ